MNKLTLAQVERIALLVEEASEVIHAAQKIIRHGYLSYHPKCPNFDNRAQLIRELGDFAASVSLLIQSGDLGENAAYSINLESKDKLWRVRKYLHSEDNVVLVNTLRTIKED
jgi:NTP pyrophosphatase (non-canonical NTP hydrolase)